MDESTIELLKEYPFDSTELDLSANNIEGILDLSGYNELTKLNCSINPITSLDNLPNKLTSLDCKST